MNIEKFIDWSERTAEKRGFMRLPEKFVETGLALADGASIFGVPLHELTHDELLAVAAQGWEAEQRARDAYAGTAGARAALLVAQARRGA